MPTSWLVLPGSGRFAGHGGRRKGGQGQVDAEDALGVAVAEGAGEHRAEIAATRREALVAEHVGHEPRPEVHGFARLEAVDPEGRGEAEAGKGGHDHIEGVGGVAAVSGGVGEGTDDLLEVPEGPGPAVREDEGHGVRALAALVNKVDRHALEVDLVVVVGVDAGFGLAPIELVPPGVQERFEVLAVHAEAPVVVGEVGGEAGAIEAAVEVGDVLVGDGDGEGFGLRHGTAS